MRLTLLFVVILHFEYVAPCPSLSSRGIGKFLCILQGVLDVHVDVAVHVDVELGAGCWTLKLERAARYHALLVGHVLLGLALASAHYLVLVLVADVVVLVAWRT